MNSIACNPAPEAPAGELAVIPIANKPDFAVLPAITVFGAAGEVSGAVSIVEFYGMRVMVDCGAYYPHGDGPVEERDQLAANKNTTLPPNTTTCDRLVWTHAHLDHIGRTPLLVRNGFHGEILATDGTAALAPVMIEMQVRWDGARLRDWTWTTAPLRRGDEKTIIKPHWRDDCRYARKISRRNTATSSCSLDSLQIRMSGDTRRSEVVVSPCKFCAELDVADVMRLVRPIKYDQLIALDDNTSLRLLDAGHIPGSASVLLTHCAGLDTTRVLFSGDLGNRLSLLAPGPEPGPPADLVVIEATYGDSHRGPGVSDQHGDFRSEVAKVATAGGVAWIPAFALDRTQKILFELRTAQWEGTLAPSVPIYCPSPSGIEITRIYGLHLKAGWFYSDIPADAFTPANLIEHLPSSELSGPAVVVSTSGMMDAAFAEVLAPLLEVPTTTVFLVGHQDPGTPGGELKRGDQIVAIGGERYEVKAEVKNYDCFSGHGDATDIDRWLARQEPGTQIVLVHGDPDALAARAKQITDAGKWQPSIAVAGIRIVVPKCKGTLTR